MSRIINLFCRVATSHGRQDLNRDFGAAILDSLENTVHLQLNSQYSRDGRISTCILIKFPSLDHERWRSLLLLTCSKKEISFGSFSDRVVVCVGAVGSRFSVLEFKDFESLTILNLHSKYKQWSFHFQSLCCVTYHTQKIPLSHR